MRTRYVELMSKFETHNRPPGGLIALNRLVSHWPHSKLPVIDAGCNSGFTSIEISRLTGKNVVGVDISETMVEAAEANALRFKLNPTPRFCNADIITFSPLSDNNIVFSGGSTVFTKNWENTVHKYVELSGEVGFCSELWFTYTRMPPDSLQKDLALILGFNVPVLLYDDMVNYYSTGKLETLDLFTMPAEAPRYQTHKEISKQIFTRDNIEPQKDDVLFLEECYRVFSENARYLSVLGVSYRSRQWPDTEWFSTAPL